MAGTKGDVPVIISLYAKQLVSDSENKDRKPEDNSKPLIKQRLPLLKCYSNHLQVYIKDSL